jgi:ssDNA-binding Zn-finger/Zn-ribbon topoisomerase 1
MKKVERKCNGCGKPMALVRDPNKFIVQYFWKCQNVEKCIVAKSGSVIKTA